jgi:RNA polymerase sigma factor (sigma-70 family)
LEVQPLTAEQQGWVESMLPLARKIADSTYYHFSHSVDMSREDIYQEACLLLCFCARRYDPAKLDSFEIYARLRLRSLHVDLLRKRYGRSNTERWHMLSLDAPVEGQATSYADFLEDESAQAAFATVESAGALKKLLKPLAPRTRKVFELLAGGKTPLEIAPQVGVGYSRISQIYQAGLQTIRREAA